MLDPVDAWLAKIRAQPKTTDLVAELITSGPGLTVFGGRPGIGKTNLVLQLAISISTGSEFLGFKTEQAIAGYVGFEGAPHKMADRLEILLKSYSNPTGRFQFALWPPTRLVGKEKIFQLQFSGMDVVILDPLKYLVAGDYTKPKDAHAFIVGLQSLATELSTHFVLVHHIRKPDKRALLDPGDLFELKGASDYVEAASTVLLLERQRQGHQPGGGFGRVNPDLYTLYVAKARDAVAAEEPISLHFDRSRLLFERASLV